MDEERRSSDYIHGTTAAEQRRLTLLNELINEAALRELALRGGERILDVGSGLGQFTRVLARTARSAAPVLGIERDAQQLAEAIRQARTAGEEHLVEFRAGDARELPLGEKEWGSFDVAHARFVLEHVREPLKVVRAMVRAVHPGGRIVLQDDDHAVIRLYPEPPGFGLTWQAYVRTYDRLGNDPYIGQRLVALLHEAGAFPRRNKWIFFGGCSGMPEFEPLAENMVTILEGARAAVLANRLLDEKYFDLTLGALRDWYRRPDAALWYAICWAEGIRAS